MQVNFTPSYCNNSLMTLTLNLTLYSELQTEKPWVKDQIEYTKISLTNFDLIQ